MFSRVCNTSPLSRHSPAQRIKALEQGMKYVQS